MTRYAAASTLMNLARCREHEGKVASAWAAYQRALQLNRETPGLQRRQELDALARRELAALEPRLPRLLVEMKQPPKGLIVQEGGRDLPLHIPVPLDPGEYELEASAPGFQRISRQVQLIEGKTTVVDLALPPAPPPPSVGPAPDTTTVKPVNEPRRIGGGDRPATPPTWVWISGAAGLLSMGAATGFALDASSTYHKLVAICGADLTCDEAPDYDPSAANTRKRRDIGLAVGLGVAGLASLTASVIGIVGARTTPARLSIAASLYFPTPASAGASMQGVF